MRLRPGTILTLLGLGLAACGGHEKKEAPAPHLGPARDVRTAEAVKTGGSGEASLPAIVQARQRASLAARVPASVTELPYQVGQSVAAGAVVVRLDDVALRSALAAAEAGFKAVAADLARTEALLSKGAATPRELEEMTARMAGAQAQVTAAKDALSYSALRAPFAGRVAARPVNLGDVASPGMTLIEIEGRGGLEVRATVEQAIAVDLRPGARLRALVDGQADPITATVTTVAPAGDATTHRFEVKASLPATAGLRAGLFARLLVAGQTGEPQVTVPVSALFSRGGLSGVLVVTEGRARLRWVAPGARAGDLVEIRAGVEAGERVVLDPAGLVDGSPVNEQRAASEAGFIPAEPPSGDERVGGPGGATPHAPDRR